MRLISNFKGEEALNPPKCTNLFFSNIVRLFGVQKMALHDHNSSFTSNFWKAFWELLGTNVLFTST